MNFDARSRSSESAMKGCSVLITKNEFAVLAALEREPGTSQRAIAARKAMSLGSVNAAYKALVDKGLVVDGALSDAGFEAVSYTHLDVYKRQPQYKGLVTMPNPKSSGTGYNFVKSLVNAWGCLLYTTRCV